MIIDGDGEYLLRVILADDKIVEVLLDLRRFDQADRRPDFRRRRLHFAVDDRLADVDARVADINARAGDDLFHLRLRLATERAERHAGGFGHGRERAAGG
jgi:hypothetical protein